MPKSFGDIKQFIRAQEAEHNVRAAQIEKKGNYIEISYEKPAVYELEHADDDSGFSAHEHLNYEQHSRALEFVMGTSLRGPQSAQQSGVQIAVQPTNRILPLPFINVPVPFTERAPKRLRGERESDPVTHAEQRVKVTIKVPLNQIQTEDDCHNLWVGLSQSAMVHTSNKTGTIIHERLAEQQKGGFFRTIARGLSAIFSLITPSFIKNNIPNFLVNLGRTRALGTSYANQVVHEPLVNSGVLAQTANVAAGVAIVGGILAAARLGIKEGIKNPDRAIGFCAASGHSDAALILALSSKGAININEVCNGYYYGQLFNAALHAPSVVADLALSASSSNSSYANMNKAMPTSYDSPFFATKSTIKDNNASPLPPLKHGHLPAEPQPGAEDQPGAPDSGHSIRQ